MIGNKYLWERNLMNGDGKKGVGYHLISCFTLSLSKRVNLIGRNSILYYKALQIIF